MIYSNTDYKQSHIASNDDFVGEDTVFYYEYIIYQNCTGRELTIYSVKYEPNNNRTIDVIRTIKPNQYFKMRDIIPFQKPPMAIELPTGKPYVNWKGRTRKTNTARTLYFLDYKEYVSTLN